jgi:hypothetical protein
MPTIRACRRLPTSKYPDDDDDDDEDEDEEDDYLGNDFSRGSRTPQLAHLPLSPNGEEILNA